MLSFNDSTLGGVFGAEQGPKKPRSQPEERQCICQVLTLFVAVSSIRVVVYSSL